MILTLMFNTRDDIRRGITGLE